MDIVLSSLIVLLLGVSFIITLLEKEIEMKNLMIIFFYAFLIFLIVILFKELNDLTNTLNILTK